MANLMLGVIFTPGQSMRLGIATLARKCMDRMKKTLSRGCAGKASDDLA